MQAMISGGEKLTLADQSRSNLPIYPSYICWVRQNNLLEFVSGHSGEKLLIWITGGIGLPITSKNSPRRLEDPGLFVNIMR
jgi:hypothetical protein